jgi:hypothetical protein
VGGSSFAEADSCSVRRVTHSWDNAQPPPNQKGTATEINVKNLPVYSTEIAILKIEQQEQKATAPVAFCIP